MFIVGAHSMHAAGYITEHEKLMSEKLAYNSFKESNYFFVAQKKDQSKD